MLVVVFAFSVRAAAVEIVPDYNLKLGYGYDDNVYRLMGRDNMIADSLLRGYFKGEAQLAPSPLFDIVASYQLGANKYLSQKSQDNVINLFNLHLRIPLNNFLLNLSTEGKFKTQRAGRENFRLWGVYLEEQSVLPFRFLTRPPEQTIEYRFNDFRYPEEELYGYHSQAGSLKLNQPFFDNYVVETGYSILGSRFNEKELGYPKRADLLHEYRFGMSYLGTSILTINLANQNSNSNIEQLDFKNSAISVRYSTGLPFDFTLIFYGSLQLKRYRNNLPIQIKQEGERVLKTESEEENFNIVYLTLSRKLFAEIYFETQLQRYSNELSDFEDSFVRSIVSIGLHGRL